MTSMRNAGQAWRGMLRGVVLLGVLSLGVPQLTAGRCVECVREKATAGFRPVSVPGMQRRAAHREAEGKARQALMRKFGSRKVSGKSTLFDVMEKNAQLKARVQEWFRTSGEVDWQVSPECAQVTVWVEVDACELRGLLQASGYDLK